MPENCESLIEAEDSAPKQLELVPSTEMPAAFFDAEIVRGEFTAARLFLQHPDKYKAAVSLVVEGFPVRAIARGLKISHNTIRQVCIREHVSIDTGREAVTADYKLLERLLMERMIDCVDQIKPEALPMALGIVRDKINAMEGNPTMIVGHVDVSVQIGTVNDFIDTLPVASGEVIEPHNGVGEGKDFAMGSLEGGDGPGPEAAEGTKEGGI